MPIAPRRSAPRRPSVRARIRGLFAAALAAVLGPSIPTASAQTLPRLLHESNYTSRLRAMWRAQCIANWTGLKTEGWGLGQPGYPFLTDADWGTTPPWIGAPLEFVLTQNPWRADDDTDIEYVYLHLLHNTPPGTLALEPPTIATGWIAHINRFIWVSNASARDLMGRGVLPPSTALAAANANRLMIDAQLTTEFFGAFCPGMPERALELANLPILTTASGHAAHASQFYVVLYALAPVVPADLSGRDRALWLYQSARTYIPDTSKAADIADFVLADFLSNPDPNDWERTRDRVFQRYQVNATANGFRYRAWYESSVNFAMGCTALLYGACDLRRTIQIGTLSGWDSDNATATLGGLIGLMIDIDGIDAQFPGVTFSDRFDIYRTRDNLPDYLPADPAAQDTLTAMASRMVALTRTQILAAGGLVDDPAGLWLLPPANTPTIDLNPLHRQDLRSATNRVRRAGGLVTPSTNFGGSNPGPGRGSNWTQSFCNGLETRFDGVEEDDGNRFWYTTQGATLPPGNEIILSVAYDRQVDVAVIRFIEGDHLTAATPPAGGWFTNTPTVEARIGGIWTTLTTTLNESQDPARPFQILDFTLASPVRADAIRLRVVTTPESPFITCSELDALTTTPTAPPAASFDLDGDGQLKIDDLYRCSQLGIDLDGDGIATEADARYLERAIRWNEPASALHPR